MNYEVEDQYNVFIKDVETGLLSHELYLREDEYEDEYSQVWLIEDMYYYLKELENIYMINYPISIVYL